MIGRLSPKIVFRFLILYNLFFWFSRELARPSISISLADRINSTSLIGMLLALQSFLPILFAIPASSIGDKYGHDRIMHLGSYLTMASGICFLIAGLEGISNTQYMVLLSVGQVISGISWMIVWIALQALTTESSQDSSAVGNVRRGINQLVLVMSIGSLLGPLAAGQLLTKLNSNAVWITYAVLAVIQFVISRLLLAFWKGKRLEKKGQEGASAPFISEPGPATNVSIRERWGQNWLKLGGMTYAIILIGTFIMMFGSEIRGSYLTVYLRGAGLEADDIGNIVMLGALASGLVRVWLNLPVAKNFSRRQSFALSLISTVSGILSIAFLPAGYANCLSSILLGLGGGIGEPILILFIVESVARPRRGMALAGRVLTNRLAMFMSPFSAGWAVYMMGNRGGFITIGVTLGALGAFSMLKLNILLKRGMLHDNDSVSKN